MITSYTVKLTPSANAAWFRFNILTDKLLRALTRLALLGDVSDARPKRLRFMVFNTVGKVVHHARRTLLRLTAAGPLGPGAQQHLGAQPDLAGD